MNLGFTERSALQAIIESPDPRVMANERLRAIELLPGPGGIDDDGTLQLARWLAGMSDAELRATIAGYFPIAVDRD